MIEGRKVRPRDPRGHGGGQRLRAARRRRDLRAGADAHQNRPGPARRGGLYRALTRVLADLRENAHFVRRVGSLRRHYVDEPLQVPQGVGVVNEAVPAAGGVVLRRAAEHHDWLAVVARRHELHDAPNLPPRPLSFIYISGARCTKSAAAAACGGPKTTGCFRPRQLFLLFIFREFSLRKQG